MPPMQRGQQLDAGAADDKELATDGVTTSNGLRARLCVCVSRLTGIGGARN